MKPKRIKYPEPGATIPKGKIGQLKPIGAVCKTTPAKTEQTVSNLAGPNGWLEYLTPEELRTLANISRKLGGANVLATLLTIHHQMLTIDG